MNNIIIQEKEIQNLIYEVRGKQVMLDSDLAEIYEVETKRINEAVKNNPDKFPERFMFRIEEFEYSILKSKISTSKGGSRKGHTVFTEQGVYMLATILKSRRATQVTLNIMDAFVAMRHFIGNNLLVHNNISNMVLKHDNDIKKLQETFDKFIKPEEKNHILFEGQMYDSYSLLLDIFNKSKSEIIIIDNYADRKLLDILCKIDKKVIIYSKNMDEELIKKYNKQYSNVKVIHNNRFHDRFIIIDKSILYHSGMSFKDMGNKCFAINIIEDKKYLNRILEELGVSK